MRSERNERTPAYIQISKTKIKFEFLNGATQMTSHILTLLEHTFPMGTVVFIVKHIAET